LNSLFFVFVFVFVFSALNRNRKKKRLVLTGIAIFRSFRVKDKFQLSHIKGLVDMNNFAQRV